MANNDDRPYIPVTRTDDAGSTPDWRDTVTNPPVLVWYKVYCMATALMYGGVILLGLVMLMIPAFLQEFMSSTEKGVEALDQVMNMVLGGIYVLTGLFFAIIYLAGAFLPARPWSWVVGIVLIALSFTSCCCIPVAIPLLIFWIKPEAKAYFHAAS